MITFKLEGVPNLQAQLKELGAELAQNTLRAAARKAFEPVLAAAVAKVPVDTGNLRQSIKIGSSKPKGGETVIAVGLVVANNAGKGRRTKDNSAGGAKDPYYWRFVEKGTRKKDARPFLRPALDGNADRVIDQFSKELAKAIDKAVKKRAGKK